MAKKEIGRRRSSARHPQAPQTFLLRTVVERDEDVYHASCPALPGCFSWGRTAAEALDNLREVARLWIAAKQEAGESIPVPVVELKDGLIITAPVQTITVAA
jgi:predicted RNase H-like HicB family nuclease